MTKASAFAECALLGKWDKYKYSVLDCQGFVEAVLKDIGIRKSDGSVYNWTGSNSMYRNFYQWRGSVEECIKQFGKIPIGAFVYIWESSGEQARGYTDGLGNAKHVGIYCGDNKVRDSTRSTKSKRDGVGTRTMEGFNRVTLFSGLDYELSTDYNTAVENLQDFLNNLVEFINSARDCAQRMEGLLNDLRRG